MKVERHDFYEPIYNVIPPFPQEIGLIELPSGTYVNGTLGWKCIQEKLLNIHQYISGYLDLLVRPNERKPKVYEWSKQYSQKQYVRNDN